jgi:hypothetical protein
VVTVGALEVVVPPVADPLEVPEPPHAATDGAAMDSVAASMATTGSLRLIT